MSETKAENQAAIKKEELNKALVSGITNYLQSCFEADSESGDYKQKTGILEKNRTTGLIRANNLLDLLKSKKYPEELIALAILTHPSSEQLKDHVLNSILPHIQTILTPSGYKEYNQIVTKLSHSTNDLVHILLDNKAGFFSSFKNNFTAREELPKILIELIKPKPQEKAWTAIQQEVDVSRKKVETPTQDKTTEPTQPTPAQFAVFR